MALKPESVKLVLLVISLPICEYVPALVLERYTLYPVAPLTADQLTVRLEEVELPTVRPLGVAGAGCDWPVSCIVKACLANTS